MHLGCMSPCAWLGWFYIAQISRARKHNHYGDDLVLSNLLYCFKNKLTQNIFVLMPHVLNMLPAFPFIQLAKNGHWWVSHYYRISPGTTQLGSVHRLSDLGEHELDALRK